MRRTTASTSVTTVDWNSRDTLLKAEFPMSVSNAKAAYDLGIGLIERGNNTATAYEAPALKWADLTDADGSYGISVLNDCKYGWDKPADNTIRLTSDPHSFDRKTLSAPARSRSGCQSLHLLDRRT